MKPMLVVLLAASTAMGAVRRKEPKVLSPADVKRIEEAMPAKAPAAPAKPRKVLVWGHLGTHGPNPYAAEALKLMGKKTGAFEAMVSDDPKMLLPESIAEFDAVVMNNIHEREPFVPEDIGARPKAEQDAARALDAALKKSLLAFVSNGKGIVGIHAATAALQKWPEYGEMMGGYYGGHIATKATLKNEEPDHPVNVCFGGRGFTIHDEFYISRAPYSREKLRVLLSLDLEKMPDPKKRDDKDYAVSWVREHGKGRVFYTTMGHMSRTYSNTAFLEHLLAGVQFAIGDLKAPAAPR